MSLLLTKSEAMQLVNPKLGEQDFMATFGKLAVKTDGNSKSKFWRASDLEAECQQLPYFD